MSWRWLRWTLVPILVVPVALLLFMGLGRDPREISSPLVGEPLPALEGSTLTGESYSSAEAGGPMLVNVWASWCTPCVVEHPVLLSAAASHPELQLVGVLYQDSADRAADFLLRNGDGGWPTLLDPGGDMALDLGVTGPPESFFVDADGVVRLHVIGPLTEQRMDEGLALIGVTS